MWKKKKKNTNRKKFIFFNVVQKSMSRTKSKLNIITFVYTTIEFFILTLLFKQQKVGSNLGTGKEIKTKTNFSTMFILHCA